MRVRILWVCRFLIACLGIAALSWWVNMTRFLSARGILHPTSVYTQPFDNHGTTVYVTDVEHAKVVFGLPAIFLTLVALEALSSFLFKQKRG